jgi:hypothetical protein
MYGARLSYNQLRFYYAILLSRGLIAKAMSTAGRAADDDSRWVATDRGRQYIEAYAALRAIVA